MDGVREPADLLAVNAKDGANNKSCRFVDASADDEDELPFLSSATLLDGTSDTTFADGDAPDLKSCLAITLARSRDLVFRRFKSMLIVKPFPHLALCPHMAEYVRDFHPHPLHLYSLPRC